jgi:3-keto-disaccharide hydrolase
MTAPSRRQLLTAAAALGASLAIGERHSWATGSEVRYDFTRPFDGWEAVTGKWGIEDVPGASRGRALVQRATNNAFNVIVAPGGPYTDVDVSVRFKPISGGEDASAGIVLRFSEGRYYVVRANALEDNFNLYYYDRGRHQITGARVRAPALGQWHKLRITPEGDHIKGWLNDQLLIDHRDSRFTSGRVGLWTKTDSITAFDDLVVSPMSRGWVMRLLSAQLQP